jgi:hypothetical protein
MRQQIDFTEAEEEARARGALPRAWLESLQSLQEAYEDWKLATGQGVSVVDLFWSWHLQA